MYAFVFRVACKRLESPKWLAGPAQRLEDLLMERQHGKTHSRCRINCSPCYALCRQPLVSHWGAVLALWGHPGGPLEQQEGHMGVQSPIFSDFGMISGQHVGSCLSTEVSNSVFVGLVSRSFLPISAVKSGRLRLPKTGSRMKGITYTKSNFSWKIFLMMLGSTCVFCFRMFVSDCCCLGDMFDN